MNSYRQSTICFQFTIIFFISFAIPLCGQEPKSPNITLSKGTTRIAQPVDSLGFPNYIAAVNEARHIPAEKNAAVEWVQIFGNIFFDTPETDNLYAKLEEYLGAKLPVKGDPVLIAANDYFISIDHHEKTDLKDDEKFYRNFRITKRPWKREHAIVMFNWLSLPETQRALKLFDRMTEKDQFVLPYLYSGNRGHAQTFDDLRFTYSTVSYYWCRLVLIQAMLDLGEGRHEEAVRRVQQLYKLASFISQQYATIEKLYPTHLYGMAYAASVAVIQEPTVSDELLLQHTRFLESYIADTNVPDATDTFERYMGLSAICMAAKTKLTDDVTADNVGNLLSLGDGPMPLITTLLQSEIDFDEALKAGNDRYDSYRELEKLSGAELLKLREAKNDQIKKEKRDLISSSIRAELMNTPQARGKFLGQFSTLMLAPDAIKLFLSQVYMNANSDLLNLVSGLERYHRIHKTYPKQLMDLQPEFIKNIPIDQFSGEQLHYSTDGASYQLFSIGFQPDKIGSYESGVYYKSR